MQLGFVSAILPDSDQDEVLNIAQLYDYDCVELMCWPTEDDNRRYAGVSHLSVADFSQTDSDTISKKIIDQNIFISGLGYYPNILTPNPDEAKACKDHLKEVIKTARMLGINVVNTFIGRDWTKSIEDNWPLVMQVWPELIKFAEDYNVKIAIENCPMLFTKDEWPGGKNIAFSPATWRRLFNDIPSNHLGLNFDPSHLVWQHIDYLYAISEFKDKIFHVHAKDVRIDRDRLNENGILAHPNDFHTPKLPGLGEINWGKFISVLGDCGYDGPVCVEVEDRIFERNLATRIDSLKQSARFMRQYIP